MDVRKYTGKNLYVGDLPELVQRGYRASVKGSLTYYGDSVDAQMIDDQVRLCEATADYLYAEHTPLDLRYERGTRPGLEDIVDGTLDGVKGERERLLALMRFVRDIYQLRPIGEKTASGDPFGGGTEEEVIKKGSSMCNEQGRVLCVLCQIAGIPARYVGHYIDHHGLAECYVEGGWAYVDIEGRYFLKPDGSLAGTWDLKQDPDLITSQSKEVLAEFRKGKGFDLARSIREFSPVEVTVITNYVVWDFHRYNYDWIWHTSETLNACRETADEFPDELSHKDLLAMARGEQPLPE